MRLHGYDDPEAGGGAVSAEKAAADNIKVIVDEEPGNYTRDQIAIVLKSDDSEAKLSKYIKDGCPANPDPYELIYFKSLKGQQLDIALFIQELKSQLGIT